LLADHIPLRADMLIGIGEEVLITRPGLFGPQPTEIAEIVFASLKHRLMAHTAEDLTTYVIESMGEDRPAPLNFSDIKSGFVLQFNEAFELDIQTLQSEVEKLIEADLDVKPYDNRHIKFGDIIYPCSGPRIHSKSTGKVKGFKLKNLEYDSKTGLYLLAGIVGEESSQFDLSHYNG